MHDHMCSAMNIQLSYFSMIQETNPGEALWAAGHRPTLARRNAALAHATPFEGLHKGSPNPHRRGPVEFETPTDTPVEQRSSEGL